MIPRVCHVGIMRPAARVGVPANAYGGACFRVCVSHTLLVMSEHTPMPTARELHERGGVSLPYAYQLLSGIRSPSLSVALRLEEAFGIPPTTWPLPRRESKAA